MKNLEDFRLNRYLAPFLAQPKNGPHEAIEMSYTIYAIHAFYSTIEDVKDLEHQQTFVNNGRRSTITIAMWFLALESFVNCLCKAVCLKQNRDFAKELSKISLGKRIGILLDTFPVEGKIIRNSGLIGRINDFVQFRNEIFHDRNVGNEIDFRNANFSKRPFFNNQVDVFQSMLIFLELSCGLRYIISGLDLMANISIGHKELLFFEKLDKLYNEFLKPFLVMVLAKHNLSTTLRLNIEEYYQPKPNSNTLFKIGEVMPVFQNQQQPDFLYPLNQEKTTIGESLYSKLITASDKPKGHFGSMNFVLDWEKLYSDVRQ